MPQDCAELVEALQGAQQLLAQAAEAVEALPARDRERLPLELSAGRFWLRSARLADALAAFAE